MLAVVALGLRSAQTCAQNWPTRPVTHGGAVPGRRTGRSWRPASSRQHLSERLGQQIIIENIGGAGGTTGAARVAKAPPDGSIFLFGNQATHTFSQLMYKKPLYNAVDRFRAGRHW